MTRMTPEAVPADTHMAALRPDLQLIADQIPAGARILDVGCDDGALLSYLVRQKQVDGRGIELSDAGVRSCVARGLCVVQGDADGDLRDYSDNSFDVVVLSKTLQAVKRPHLVLRELIRIGKTAIVTIPNFGQWRVRTSLLLRGRMPVTAKLAASWYETDNIHFCTILDIMDLIRAEGLRLVDFVPHQSDGRRLAHGPQLANWTAEQALFVLTRDVTDGEGATQTIPSSA